MTRRLQGLTRKIGRHMTKWALFQFKNALGGEAWALGFDVAYTGPSQVTADHFSSDDFFYFEILGDNYHLDLSRF